MRRVDSQYPPFYVRRRAAFSSHEQLRLLFRADGFSGWDSAAAMRLTRFGLRHAAHVERLAVVGEPEVQKCIDRPIVQNTGVRARHFLPAELGRAWSWLREKTDTWPQRAVELLDSTVRAPRPDGFARDVKNV